MINISALLRGVNCLWWSSLPSCDSPCSRAAPMLWLGTFRPLLALPRSSSDVIYILRFLNTLVRTYQILDCILLLRGKGRDINLYYFVNLSMNSFISLLLEGFSEIVLPFLCWITYPCFTSCLTTLLTLLPSLFIFLLSHLIRVSTGKYLAPQHPFLISLCIMSAFMNRSEVMVPY